VVATAVHAPAEVQGTPNSPLAWAAAGGVAWAALAATGDEAAAKAVFRPTALDRY